MEKFKELLKMKIEDETAAFTILGVMIVTFAILIGTFEFIQHNRTAEASSNISMSQTEHTEELEPDNINEVTNDIKEETKNKVDEEKAKEENEKKYEKLKEENKISSAADKYYIKVNYGAQVITVYEKDENGKYTVPVRAMLCSTGRATPTSGVYRTLDKGKWWGLYGDVYGQYSTWICGDILFHSVPYLTKGDKSSLEYWAYDQLGQRVSMGCVRLTVADAKWIYDNCVVGTQVEFYSSSNPGPWGRPETMKISNAPDNIRGWDPTDPDSRNPWTQYLKELAEKEEEENTTDKNEVVNEITNELVNDIANEIVNEVANEIVDDTVNEIVNNVADENVNDVINDIKEPIINEIEQDTVNTIINGEQDDLPSDVYINATATTT